MIKINLDGEKLKEAYDIAERENRTLLGVIYNNYIYPETSRLGTLNPRNIYVNKSLVLKMIELDKSLNTEDVDIMYLQYGPSISLKRKLRANEILVQIKTCNN